MKHNEEMENIKEWSDAVKEKLTTHKRYTEEEFTYPMWFRSKYGEIIVRFISLDKGIVIYTSNEEPFYKIGMFLSFQPHTDTTIWQQVENPNLEIENKEHKKDSSRGDGGSTNYYELPKDATELRHLIRYKKMSHPIGEIFCAIYRLNDNGEYLRNLKKAKFYIDSEIEEYEKENK